MYSLSVFLAAFLSVHCALFIDRVSASGGQHGAFCGLADDADVLNGNAQITGNLCVGGLSVGGHKFIPPADDPCEKIVYDSLGQARRARVPNCCSQHSDCPTPSDINHYPVCEQFQCKVKQRFTESGQIVCQSHHACQSYKTSPCQTATCVTDPDVLAEYGFGPVTSSSSSSSSWSSSSSFDTMSLDDSDVDVKYLGYLPEGVGICRFETSEETDCCERSSDCWLDPHRNNQGCCVREICDGGNKCQELEVAACACGDDDGEEDECAEDEDCSPLNPAYQGVPIGPVTQVDQQQDEVISVTEQDCIPTVCQEGSCVPDDEARQIVSCAQDADEDGFFAFGAGHQCAPTRYCGECPDSWSEVEADAEILCDCDDTDASVNPDAATFLACPNVLPNGSPSYDNDCDGEECVWDAGFQTCEMTGSGTCQLDEEGWILYESYDDAVEQFDITLSQATQNPRGGLAENCAGQDVSLPEHAVCRPGINVGFMYNLEQFSGDCDDENFELASSDPHQVFVNVVGGVAIANLDSAGYKEEFCTAISACQAAGWSGSSCTSSDDNFEILLHRVQSVMPSGPACMINVAKHGGKAVPPPGYCAEWGQDCSAFIDAVSKSGSAARTSTVVCLPAVGVSARSIEVQKAI